MKQTSEGQQATQQARAMRKALLRDHGVAVPHSALRAVLLQLQGLHPHAQRPQTAQCQDGACSLSPEAWTAWVDHWMGEWDVVLKKPAYELMLKAPFQEDLAEQVQASQLAQTAAASEPRLVKELYLVEDEAGCLEVLAFDKDGTLPLPEDALQDRNVELTSLNARVPSIRKYGLPDYVAHSKDFFASRFDMHLPICFSVQLEDSRDDSGDEARLGVRVRRSDWEQLLRASFAQGTSAGDDLREWLGLHYRKHFDSCSAIDQLDWMERFIDRAA